MLPSHNCIIIITMFSFQGTWLKLFKRLSEASDCVWYFNQSLWWRVPGSNRRPPACGAGALPAELTPQVEDFEVVGQNGLAFLRKSHAGCNSPPDCCQEPAFESILVCILLELDLSRS